MKQTAKFQKKVNAAQESWTRYGYCECPRCGEEIRWRTGETCECGFNISLGRDAGLIDKFCALMEEESLRGKLFRVFSFLIYAAVPLILYVLWDTNREFVIGAVAMAAIILISYLMYKFSVKRVLKWLIGLGLLLLSVVAACYWPWLILIFIAFIIILSIICTRTK